MKKTLDHEPLKRGPKKDIEIEDKSREDAVQYEFYIPAAIWKTKAVKKFLASLSTVTSGATIFKGATGIWKGEEEDTYIYRIILGDGEYNKKNIRIQITRLVRKMMAKLAEWKESKQEAFLFTENVINSTLTEIVSQKTSILTGRSIDI